MKKQRKGFITPFAAVSLVLVLSLFLTLLEGARYNYAQIICSQQAIYGARGFMGQYHRDLKEEYGIFGVSPKLYSIRDAILRQSLSFQTGDKGTSLLNPKGLELSELRISLLTDDGAYDFRKQAVEDFLGQFPELIWEDWAKGAMRWKFSEQGLYEDEVLEEAEASLEKAKEQMQEENLSAAEDVANPMDEMKKQKQSFVLSMVLPEDFEVSRNVLGTNQPLEERNLHKGTIEREGLAVTGEQILFPLYLNEHFSNALSEEYMEHGLNYGLEYMLIGAPSDYENLEGVVNRIILIRELEWLAYRLTDGTSWSQAVALSTAIMGGLGVPALIEPVALGIVLAWAYGDALEDVRMLMSGGRICLWPAKGAQETREKKNLATGMVSYQEILLFMLMVSNQKTNAYRALDIIEDAFDGEGDFAADQVITAVEATVEYEYTPLFLHLGDLVGPKTPFLNQVISFSEGYSI